MCIPVYGAYDRFAQCLHSVLETAPPDVRVVVADDASPDPAIGTLVKKVNEARADRVPVVYLRQAENIGFVRNVNAALRSLDPADVVVVNRSRTETSRCRASPRIGRSSALPRPSGRQVPARIPRCRRP